MLIIITKENEYNGGHIAEKKRKHKKEEEMRQMFVNKVKETEAELKEKEREVSVPETPERSPKYSQP